MAGLEDEGPSKQKRGRAIIKEAAEQSARSRLPELLPISPLIHALNDIPAGALAIMPWEEEHNLTLRDVLSAQVDVNIGTTLAVDRTMSAQAKVIQPYTTVVLYIDL